MISDRDSDHTRAPIPSLLAVSAVHHHLVHTKPNAPASGWWWKAAMPARCTIIAMLIGFGAAAVNPYLAFESIEDLIREGELTGIEAATAVRNYLTALGKGVTKVMSKMGISTVSSYTGAQAFEAIGLDRAVIDEYFTGTTDAARRGRPRRAGRRGQVPPPPGLSGEPHRAGAPAAVGGRRVPVPPGRRTAPASPRKWSSCCSMRRAPAAGDMFAQYSEEVEPAVP